MAKEDRKAGLKHECELPPEPDEFAAADALTSGQCISLKRFLMKSIMIWRYNSQSLKTYKSDYVIRCENIMQLKLKNYVLHPFSVCRVGWEMVMIIAYGLTFMMPITNILSYNNNYFHYALACFNFLDIMMSFNTGFQIKNTSKVIMKRKIIVKQYLMTLFMPHLISCIFQCFRSFEWHYLHYLQFLVLIRIHTFIKYLNNIEAYQDSYTSNNRIVRWGIAVIIMFIWALNLFYIAKDAPKNIEKARYHYIKIFYRIFCNLYLLGYYNQVHDPEILIIDIIATTIGFALHLLAIKFILRICRKFTYSRHKYLEFLQQVENFAIIKRLPLNLRNKMQEYIRHLKLQRKFDELKILGNMSKSLRTEVHTFVYSQLLEKSIMFKFVPLDIIYKLTNRLTSTFYMPSDVIVTAGTKAEIMYFIKSGSVAIYTYSGKEVCHLNDGSSFGELSVVDNEVRNATVVAIDWCEICMLSRDDLFEVFENYQELLERIKLRVSTRATIYMPTQMDDWSNLETMFETDSLDSDESRSNVLQI